MTAMHIDNIRFSPWIGFRTLFLREVVRYMKLAVQTLVAPFLSNLLFLSIFGGLMSARSGGGVPYIRFLIPGLVFMGAFLSAFQNPLFSIVAMKYQNTLQDLCQYPLSAASRFFAFALAGALRGFLVGVMTYAAAGLFGGYTLQHPLLFWLYIAGASFVAASGGIFIGLLLDSFEKTNFVVSLILTPVMFLAGVFHQAGTSAWLDLIARFNPLSFLVGQGRNFFLGTERTFAVITVSLGAVFCAASVMLAVWAIDSRKGMKIE
jgi:ABC-2 type transport system permease protein